MNTHIPPREVLSNPPPPVRYLSLFSGIEAASVAWKPIGWECVGVAEIEPFPCAVLNHHFPTVPNLGDVTQITDDQIKELGQIDLIVGGFPCQDLSVAGKRKGMQKNETRSGLFYDAIRIVWAARKHCGLRWLLLENVPGIYSNRAGRTLHHWLTKYLEPDSVFQSKDGKTPVWLLGRTDSSNGALWMRSTSESRNAAAACSLSQILETGPIDPRYFLSAKACSGILRRAGKRGKSLPPQLAHALKAVADLEPTSSLTAD